MEFEFGELIVDEELEFGELELDVIKQQPPLIDLEINPTKEEQIFNHVGEYGYDVVKVNAVKLQDKVVELSENEQIVEADDDYVGLNSVKVPKIEPVILPYKPRHILFTGYTGDNLTKEINNLDTSDVTNMGNMFGSCSKLTNLNLNNFDTSKVTTMSNMFYGCNELTELDLSSFVVTNVTNISQMFYNCNKLISLDLSSFITDSITNMQSTFRFCRSLSSIKLDKLDTSKVTTMYQMFGDCVNLRFLDIRKFNFDKVTNSTSMFTGVPADCLIIVKSDTEKAWVLARRSDFTNVKTLDEYKAEGGV